MNDIQHKGLKDRWKDFSFYEQMANIGSEVIRALNWEQKQKKDYSYLAFTRALELLDFTTEGLKDYPKLKELKRLRECLVDYFAGKNIYGSSPGNWNSYFNPFFNAYSLHRNL